MNLREAIPFFEKKQGRVRNVDSIEAYATILELLRTETYGHSKDMIRAFSHNSPSPERRAIYRLALRELEI